MGSQRAAQIAELENMGFERTQIDAAMRAAFYNSERAVEYLLTVRNPKSYFTRIILTMYREFLIMSNNNSHNAQQLLQPAKPLHRQCPLLEETTVVMMSNSTSSRQLLRQADEEAPQVLVVPQLQVGWEISWQVLAQVVQKEPQDWAISIFSETTPNSRLCAKSSNNNLICSSPSFSKSALAIHNWPH